MNRVFLSIKEYIKKRLGDRYEVIIRQPYVRLRRLKRVIVLEFINFLPYSIRKHIQPLTSLEEELIYKTRDLQLRLQLRMIQKGKRHPLWFTWYLLMIARVRRLESHYRQYYRHLDAVCAASRADVVARSGVLLISGSLAAGGSERQVVVTAIGLARRLATPVALAVVNVGTELLRFYHHQLDAAGLSVIELNRDGSQDEASGENSLLRVMKAMPMALTGVEDYARTLLAKRPEIVHLWLDEVNIKGGLAAVAAGVPRIILSSRSLPPNNFLLYQSYMREGYRWLLRQPGVTLINNSTAGARAYERWLGLRKGSIKVVHNGFDFDADLLERCREQRTDYRERHGIPPTVPVMGTVIRISEEKRPLLWAEIAARVGKIIPEAHFLVVGDGVLRKELEMRAAQPDLVGKLHIVGLEKQALEAMAAMDLFLLSSRGEGLPNVLVEAQALGIPVVTTRVGGAPEALQHKITGWVLSDDRPEHAAAEIVRLLKDPAWLHAAGKAGPEFVKGRFGLERMLDETMQLYESPQLTGSARRRARVIPETAP